MTKKPSEKNKAWEKDRRDRLNKTFDELAKLLPKYDGSIVWSKVEIIQKAIVFINELQTKHEDYLKAQDPSIFREYEEFVNCIRFYQERNAQLTELLKKTKVTLPPFVLPKLLVNKPELIPDTSNKESITLQKPKRQRASARKNVLKKSEVNEDVESKCFQTKAFEADPIQNPNKKLQSIPALKGYAKENNPDVQHSAVGTENPSQGYSLPLLQPSPAKPIFLRLKKKKTKSKLKHVHRQFVRKCYPHPDKLIRFSDQCMGYRKIIYKPNRCSTGKYLQKKCLKKELKLGNIGIPLREQSVSPTVAFLLSFPVVASSAVSDKNVENGESSVSLENLNNFFTSEEYSQFCDQNSDEKLNVIAIASLPLESEKKAPISSKPLTAFSVSAITRPTSPKKRPGTSDDQMISKRSCEKQWVAGNKFNFNQKITSSESYNYQRYAVQHSLATTDCLSFSAHQPKLSLGSSACLSSSHSNRKTYATITNDSSLNSKTVLTSNSEKRINGVESKTPNVALKTVTKQLPTMHSDYAVGNIVSWDVKPVSSKKNVLHNPGVSASKNIGHMTKTLPIVANEAVSKAFTKTSVNSFYSSAKNFFHELSPPKQSINSSVLGEPVMTATYSQTDPLFSSTITKKSQPLTSFPSIKSEFPWLKLGTTLTMSLTPTTPTTTTTAACNPNAVPLDLGSVVSETLTSTSCTLAFNTTKSFDNALVGTGNKQIPDIKSINQVNTFTHCNEVQFTPRVTSSLAKETNTQLNIPLKEMPWKQEKTKAISDQIFYDCEQSKMQQKNHVNWMTSTANDFQQTQATVLPSIDFVNQCPTSTTVDFGIGCRKDSYDEENQFINWSPTKPLNTDFSSAYTFENFGSSEAPPNKTVKQIFSVSQLVDQAPSQESSSMKKAVAKEFIQKSTPAKHSFSNIYSAESLIAKKDNHRMVNAVSIYHQDASNTQTDYHAMSNYAYNYPNVQSCLQPENDYLGVSSYTSSLGKTTLVLPSTGLGTTLQPPTMPPYESSIASSPNNYFGHSTAVNTNDPYDPTYLSSNNFNPATASWHPCTTKIALSHTYNQNQIPLSAVSYGTVESVSQQSSNATGNLTNFNLRSICPEIDGKQGSTVW